MNNSALVSDSVGTELSGDEHQSLRLVTPGSSDAAPQRNLVQATGVHKSYRKGQHPVPVLQGVDLEVRAGEFVAIIGQSGSGKSTLLHLMGTLDAPDAGEIHYQGQRIDGLPGRQRDHLRNREFGMVFQFYHLLPELSTLENILLPSMISRSILGYLLGRRKLEQEAERLLDLVGLGHRSSHRPRELSGGEMQRAAVARALLNNPRLLLADEPTGNLDRETGEGIMQMLRSLNTDEKLTIVMVTHDPHIARQADRVVRLTEGRVTEV